MRRSRITAIAASAGMLASTGAAQAQFFNFTTSFTPNPVPSTVAGNNIQASTGSNNTGLFAGAFGTDVVLDNFIANAVSTTTGVLNSPVTIFVTLTDTNSNGVQIAGTSPVTHTFLEQLNGAIDSNAVTSSMTPIPNPSIQTYVFSNGDAFTLQINSYTGPSAPNSTASGALGGHVNGALAGVPQGAPEPGSLALLLGIGISGSLLGYRRRRR